MAELRKCLSETIHKTMEGVSEKSLTAKCRHSCAMFGELKKFQQDGLLCDTTVRSGDKTMDVHRVVLLSAKSFDSDYISDLESSESESDDETHQKLSCSDEPVFEDVYPSEDEMSHLNEQMEHINTLRIKGECCDITLQASSERFPAHKVVLAAASEYFKIMFTSSMKEKDLDFVKLNIDDQLDVTQLHNVLDFIYSGEIELDDDNILSVLELSVFFQISTLIQHCQIYLIDQVSKTNCCVSYALTKSFVLEDLKAESIKVIHDYFDELEYIPHDLKFLDFADLAQFLRSDNLGQCCEPCKKSERNVLANVMDWLSATDFEGAFELLKHVRFALVPKQDIESYCECLKRLPFAENVDIRCAVDFFNGALEYHDNPYEQPLMQIAGTTPRAAKPQRICVDGVLAPEALKLPSLCLHAKLPCHGDSSDKIRDPFHNLVVLNGFLYCIGGTRQTSLGYSNEVIRYDTRLDKWITVAPMNEERGDFYACRIGDHIYVFGGRNKRGVTSSCERYDPRKNLWEKISDLPVGLYMMAGAVENGVCYLSGGFTEYDAVGTTYKYVPSDNEWIELPTFMFKDRGYHVMINDGRGNLWAIGGVDNPFAGRNVWEVERFDIADEMWNYVGQVLAVNPFLSVQRLNAYIDSEERICVFAVTTIDHSCMMRYSIEANLWEALEDPADYLEISTRVS